MCSVLRGLPRGPSACATPVGASRRGPFRAACSATDCTAEGWDERAARISQASWSRATLETVRFYLGSEGGCALFIVCIPSLGGVCVCLCVCVCVSICPTTLSLLRGEDPTSFAFLPSTMVATVFYAFSSLAKHLLDKENLSDYWSQGQR